MGLCLGDFSVRFFTDGSARVGGGVPILSRAADFTAADALNGLSLRGLDGKSSSGCSHSNLSSSAADNRFAATERNSVLPAVAVLVCTRGSKKGLSEEKDQYEYLSGWATAPTSTVVST